jgi:hypothetical protein
MTGSAAALIGKALADNPLAAALIHSAQGMGIPCWLVGGAVRDAIAGRVLADIDLAVEGDPALIAETIGGQLGLSIFPLDKERGFYRLTQNTPIPFSCDVLRLREASITEDLLSRDFTINAIAISLAGGMEIIDPTNGLDDLNRGVLRPVSARAMLDDPLRILRGYRLGLAFGLTPAPGLEGLITAAIPGLDQVAGERLLAEMVKILKDMESHKAMAAMAADGVLTAIFPEARGVANTPRTFQRLDSILADGSSAGYLGQPVGAGITRKEVVKLAAIFCYSSDSAKERKSLASAALRRLKAPLAAAHGVGLMAWGFSAYQERMDDEAIFDWLSDMREWAPGAMALAKVCAGDNGREEVEAFATSSGIIWDRWRTSWPSGAPPVTGRDVMKTLGIPGGPMVGKLLREAEKAAALGRIYGREEAMRFIRKLAADGA